MHRRRDQRHVEKRVRRVPGPTRSIDHFTFTLLPPKIENFNSRIRKNTGEKKTKNSYSKTLGADTRPTRPPRPQRTRLDDVAWESRRLRIARCRWPSPLSGLACSSARPQQKRLVFPVSPRFPRLSGVP